MVMHRVELAGKATAIANAVLDIEVLEGATRRGFLDGGSGSDPGNAWRRRSRDRPTEDPRPIESGTRGLGRGSARFRDRDLSGSARHRRSATARSPDRKGMLSPPR